MTQPRISLTCIAERIIVWFRANWQYFLPPLFLLALLLCLIFCPGNAGAAWELVPNFTNSTGYYPGEYGCWVDCSGHRLDPSEMTCAVFPKQGITIWKREPVAWDKFGHITAWEVTEQGDIIKVVLPDGREFVLIPADVCGIPGRVDFLMGDGEECVGVTVLDNTVKVYVWR